MIKTLEQLQAENLPRANWRDFLKAEGLTADEEKTFDDYFSKFVKPGPCVACGAQQGGDVIDNLLGKAKFVWGIAHGEGGCDTREDDKRCGYPARALHYDVGPIKQLTLILQYHPDELKKP